MGKTAVITCIDARANRYLDERYASNGSNIFYRTEAANTLALVDSLADAIARRGVTDIKVLCHSDCAAINVLTKAIVVADFHNDMIDGDLVNKFNADKNVLDVARLMLMNRDLAGADVSLSRAFRNLCSHIEKRNPAKQKEHLESMFSDFVGLKISTELVDLGSMATSPNKPVSIVVTNATTASAKQICDNAGTDPSATYIIATAYQNEALNPLRLATKVVGSMINKGKVSNEREIRIVDSPVPVAHTADENIDGRRVPETRSGTGTGEPRCTTCWRPGALS